MGKLGTGISLLVIGAILTFALQVDLPGVGEYALGLILMLAGALVLVLWYVTEHQRRRAYTVVEDRTPVVEEREPIVEERRRRRFS
jgi:membrane protein implicated in regulation of membrane protease activity